MSEEVLAGTALHWGDILVIIAYFLFVISVGIWSSRVNRGSIGGYFLAGRSMHWIPVGASLFASNIGSVHFVGLAGSGAASGIGIAVYELNAIFVVLLLGWLFVPVYTASGVFTMPEYLRLRFGGQRIRVYLSVLAMLMYIFTKISADLYAGAIFLEQSMKWNIYWSIFLLLSISALFTITGGLTAVIWTDFIQTLIMIIGATTLCILSFIKVGGLEAMKEKYINAIPNSTLQNANLTCGYPRDDYMHLFRDPVTADLPWPGIIGLTINSVWYWCADQVIVQRALAAKNVSHAKAGTILTGWLKILPLFLLVFPGMIARILFPNEVGCSDPEECYKICGSRSGCSNIAYPKLVLTLMPAGARGLMLAVMMAALMSSLTSIFNSSSTIFTMDIWTRFRKHASEMELLIVGRVFVVVLVVISIIWIPVIKASEGSQLFVYVQEVSSFLQPPICAVFVLALLWKRLNELGAFCALMVGLLVGLIRFIVEYSYTVPECGDSSPDPRPNIIKNFHYLYFAIFLFVLTIIVAVVVSLLTQPIPEKYLYRLTFWSRHSRLPRGNIDDWTNSNSNILTATDDAFNDVTINQDEMVTNQDEVVVSPPTENTSKETMAEHPQSVPKDNMLVMDEDISQHPCLPFWKVILYWICGIERGRDQNKEIDEIEHEEEEKQVVSLYEETFWRRFCNGSAVVLMVVATFLWAYFG